MALILCIETATTNCSVALSFNGKQIALKEDYENSYSHAERLHTYIEEVFAQAGVEKEELSAVAVSMGPGSYTGLRIGVSSAKGLCFALDKPLIAIPTLDALAHQGTTQDTAYIVPLLDARRMEVYSAVYDTNGMQLRDTKAELLDRDSFSTYLDTGTVCFIGNGVAKFKEICDHSNARFKEQKLPSANEMCALAHAAFLNKHFENLAYFEPFYLKDFIAGKPKSSV